MNNGGERGLHALPGLAEPGMRLSTQSVPGRERQLLPALCYGRSGRRASRVGKPQGPAKRDGSSAPSPEGECTGGPPMCTERCPLGFAALRNETRAMPSEL